MLNLLDFEYINPIYTHGLNKTGNSNCKMNSILRLLSVRGYPHQILKKREIIMNKVGFDNDKYLKLQSEKIRERINSFGGKLYMEFGGKLFDDFHASRVLPGFEPDSKVRMLLKLKEQTEIIFAINAAAIEQNKMRSDIGITYDMDILRLIDKLTEIGLYVGSVVITQYNSRPTLSLS